MKRQGEVGRLKMVGWRERHGGRKRMEVEEEGSEERRNEVEVIEMIEGEGWRKRQGGR